MGAHISSCVVARELVGHAAAARAAFQRPHQRLGARGVDAFPRHAERGQPLRRDGEVFVLRERIETHPQAEALGQGNLLLDHLSRMHFAVLGVGVAEVLLHVLRQQVAAVAGGVDQDIGRRRRHRAVEDRLERLVAGFAFLEAEVVAEHDELLGAVGHHIDDVGQVGEIGLVDFDQAQALRRVFVQAGLDQRRLAGAAGARQQHVVGRPALDELQGIALDLFLLRLDFLEVVQPDGGNVANRLQRAMARRALAVTPGDRLAPVGRGQRLRQHRLDPRQQVARALDQLLEFFVHER